VKLKRWHITRDAGSVTISRGPNPRFDVSAEAHFPACDPLRLALQIRQDLWRRLQKTRGFRPVVRVETSQNGLVAKAGGEVSKNRPNLRHVSDNIVDLLGDTDNRRRWVNWASKGNRRGVQTW